MLKYPCTLLQTMFLKKEKKVEGNFHPNVNPKDKQSNILQHHWLLINEAPARDLEAITASDSGLAACQPPPDEVTADTARGRGARLSTSFRPQPGPAAPSRPPEPSPPRTLRTPRGLAGGASTCRRQARRRAGGSKCVIGARRSVV